MAVTSSPSSEGRPAGVLPQALLDPAAYPHAPAEVSLIETHISWVFLAGDRVYKVKRPVVFPFLDYGSLERRRAMCEREVELGRRLAPRLYRGVVPVTSGPAGLTVGGDGEIVAWAVEMTRLPEGALFSTQLDRGEIDNGQLRELAQVLSRFHAECATGPGVDEHGAPERLAATIRANFAETRAHVGPCVAAEVWADLERWFEAELHRLRPVLEARVAAGRVRAGHGDLRAEHICLTPGGGILVFDPIEFDPALQCCDVASEIAFLVMDLASAGFHHFGRYLARTYADLAGDETLLTVLPLFMAYRAHVRAKVDGLRWAALPDGPAREAARARAQAHYHLAWLSTRTRPLLLLTYGLAGSGKSTLSRALSRTLGLHWLRSDVVHKRLQGLLDGERLETGFLSGGYSQEAKMRTYVELLRLATYYMDRGEGVVVDASFGYRWMRQPFLEAIDARGWDHLLVHVEVDEAESRRRLDRRAAEGTDPSDATYTIYLKQRDAFEPPDEMPRRVHLDGASPLQDQLDAILAAWLRLGAAQA